MNHRLITVILAILATILFASAVSAITVADVTSSSLTDIQKQEILQLMAAGDPNAEPTFTKYTAAAEVEKNKLAAKTAADKLEAARLTALQKSWHQALSPLPIDKCWTWASSQIDSTLTLNDGHCLVDFMAKRYGDLGSGDRGKMSPQQRLVFVKANYYTQQEFRADVRQEIRASAEIRTITRQIAELKHDYAVLAHDYEVVKASSVRQDSTIACLTEQADANTDRLDTIEARLSDNEFDMAAALRELATQAKMKKDEARTTVRKHADDIAARSTSK